MRERPFCRPRAMWFSRRGFFRLFFSALAFLASRKTQADRVLVDWRITDLQQRNAELTSLLKDGHTLSEASHVYILSRLQSAHEIITGKRSASREFFSLPIAVDYSQRASNPSLLRLINLISKDAGIRRYVLGASWLGREDFAKAATVVTVDGLVYHGSIEKERPAGRFYHPFKFHTYYGAWKCNAFLGHIASLAETPVPRLTSGPYFGTIDWKQLAEKGLPTELRQSIRCWETVTNPRIGDFATDGHHTWIVPPLEDGSGADAYKSLSAGEYSVKFKTDETFFNVQAGQFNRKYEVLPYTQLYNIERVHFFRYTCPDMQVPIQLRGATQ